MQQSCWKISQYPRKLYDYTSVRRWNLRFVLWFFNEDEESKIPYLNGRDWWKPVKGTKIEGSDICYLTSQMQGTRTFITR